MSIPIHKDRGIDPHLTYCQRCGGEADELTLGVLMKAELPNGQWVYANRGKTEKLRRELEQKKIIPFQTYLQWQEITDTRERVPASEPCKKCRDELDMMEEIVKRGGCYFKCAECGQEGVLRETSTIAKQVRKLAGIEPPEPVGFEFEACVQHTPEGEGPNDEEKETPAG